MATYGYFVFCLIARQSLINPGHDATKDVDIYFPLFTSLEFIFYIGKYSSTSLPNDLRNIVVSCHFRLAEGGGGATVRSRLDT